MTFILVALTVTVVLTLELVGKNRAESVARKPESRLTRRTPIEILERYFHPGHTWITVSDQRKITVGIDEFSERIIGSVNRVDLPEVGRTIQQGEPFTRLHHNNRVLVHVAPVSGRIADVNKKLIRRPNLLNNSPLERGWIATIVPSNLETELRNLLSGVVADGWREAVRTEFIQLCSPGIGTVLQDGGQLIENLGEHFNDDEWSRLIRKFYPTISSKHIQHTPMN